MRKIRLLNRALWAVNVLLGVGIALFTWQYLVFPHEVDRLKDVKRPEPAASTSPASDVPKDDNILKSLRNPIQKEVPPAAAAPARPVLKAALKGTLPSDDPKRSIVFLRAGPRNVDLIAYVGEPVTYEGKPYDEFKGWLLEEATRESAVFSNGKERQVLTLELLGSAPAPSAGPATAGLQSAKIDRIGQPYASETFKSRLLAQAEGRQVWGLDPDELDWAAQNADRVLDQDFQVSPSASGGLRIDGVRSGSIPQARGFLAGDIVRSVNGQPLAGLGDLKTLMANASVRQSSVLSVMVERGGKPVQIEYRALPK